MKRTALLIKVLNIESSVYEGRNYNNIMILCDTKSVDNKSCVVALGTHTVDLGNEEEKMSNCNSKSD